MTGTIKKFTNNQELIKIIDKYSNGNRPLGSLIREIAVNSENSEMIVPVLGMQGMGKSTLINAMLAEDILPSDADETTCVPVEIKYGEDEQAIIFFNDRSEQTIVHKKEELQPYVDNVENPANCKGVSHIILYRKNELLKNGLTIVDLPGIGSLTAENEKTTQRYIRDNRPSGLFADGPGVARRSDRLGRSADHSGLRRSLRRHESSRGG